MEVVTNAESFLKNCNIEEIICFQDKKGGERLYKVKYVGYIWQPESALVHLQIYQEFWNARHDQKKEEQRHELLSGDNDEDDNDSDDNVQDNNDESSNSYQPEATETAEEIDPSKTTYSTNEDVYSNMLCAFEVLTQSVASIQQASISNEQHTIDLQLSEYNTIKQKIDLMQGNGNNFLPNTSTMEATEGSETFYIMKHGENQKELNKNLVSNLNEDCTRSNIDLGEEDIGSLQNANKNSSSSCKLTCELQENNITSQPNRTPKVKFHATNKTEIENKSFACAECSKVFNRASTLRRHMIIHTGEKPYQCKSCGKRFNQKSLLQRHSLTHTNEKKFTCEICGMKFFERCNLQRHRPTHHKTEKKWTCDICKKSFLLKEYLAKHKLTHGNEKPYKCTRCSKCFVDSSAWRRHEKTHEVGKKFLCYICGAESKNSVSFKRHLLTCERRIAKCYICNFSFEDKSKFEAHIRFHGSKQYSCQVCNLFYDNYLSYNEHLLTHKVKKNLRLKGEHSQEKKDKAGDRFLVMNPVVFDADRNKSPQSLDELIKKTLSNTY